MHKDPPGFLSKVLPGQPKIQLEDVLGRPKLKLRIVQAYVNTLCKSLVEIADPINGQEQHSNVVFENTEKD